MYGVLILRDGRTITNGLEVQQHGPATLGFDVADTIEAHDRRYPSLWLDSFRRFSEIANRSNTKFLIVPIYQLATLWDATGFSVAEGLKPAQIVRFNLILGHMQRIALALLHNALIVPILPETLRLDPKHEYGLGPYHFDRVAYDRATQLMAAFPEYVTTLVVDQRRREEIVEAEVRSWIELDTDNTASQKAVEQTGIKMNNEIEDRAEFWVKNGQDPDVEIFRNDFQSLAFASDLAPFIADCLADNSAVRRYTALDIGPRTACGTELLSRVFHPKSWSKLKLQFTSIDIHDRYEKYAEKFAPHVRFTKGDVFALEDKNFDIVVASHVLEHLTDPLPFLSKLRKIARIAVFIAGPYAEPPDKRIRGHFISFDDDLLAKAVPRKIKKYTSPHWHNGECFLAFYDPE